MLTLLSAMLFLQASAARALQRLNDIPELKEQLANSSARDMVAEGNSNSNSSLLNTTCNGPAATGAAAAAVTTFAVPAAAAVAVAGAGAAAATAAAGGSGLILAARNGSAAGAAAADGAGVEVDDLKQLAEVLASNTNKWLREKAAAAVEQLAADDPQACRYVPTAAGRLVAHTNLCTPGVLHTAAAS